MSSSTGDQPASPAARLPGQQVRPDPAGGEPRRARRLALISVVGLATLAAIVLLVQQWRSTPGMQGFIARYPGDYPLPAGATPGFPAWVSWTHFLTFFLMVLIIRSGWHLRHEQRPMAYWTPATLKDGNGKISLMLWFHLVLDVLWLVNGVVFVVLLFATDHWMRLVPTSSTVFPNAASVLVQYVSLDWPAEHGWVVYNSLQQLAYFAVVFVAAPLAAVTGFRLSSIWPGRAQALNRVYPVEVARAVHYPTMLFFFAFIVFHIALVLATGARRNLNHMFGGSDSISWVGFGVFAVALAITALAWIAARPVVLATLAGVSGRVSNR